MLAIKAMIKNGYLVSVNPVDLPEGSQLEVTANDAPISDQEQMTELNWPRTPEGIAALLARMDSRQPLSMSEEENFRWERIRREDKDRELALADTRDERLHKTWE